MNNNTLKIQFLQDVSDMIKDADLDKFRCEDALHNLKYHISCANLQNEHATISVYNTIESEYIDIDQNIASLLECMWANNISTLMSCENNVPDNYIWIQFETSQDLELFLEIVFKDLDPGDNFYDRGFPGWGKKDGWYHDIIAGRNMKDEVSISISIRFPQKDHDTVLNKLKLNLEHKPQSNDHNIIK